MQKLPPVRPKDLMVAMAITIAVILIALFFGLKAREAKGEATPESEVTVVVDPVDISANACVLVESHDTIPNMVEDGYNLDYSAGVWYFNDRPIGVAQAEDEPFLACGDPQDINIISNYEEAQR